jgi:uncharacterized membrane protein required for colicin V production
MSFDTSGILKILGMAAGIFAAIQGLKNIFPALFDKIPNLGRWIAALAALAAALVPCLTGGIDLNCILAAVLTFLSAVGIYHSVSQAGGAVNPPLPPSVPK